MFNLIDMKGTTKDVYRAPEVEEIVLLEKLMTNNQSQLEGGKPGDEWDDFS